LSPDASPPRDPLDADLDLLAGRKEAWGALALEERAACFEAALERIPAAAPEWVRRLEEIQGLEPGSPWSGELWLSGPVATARGFRLLAASLRQAGRPALPGPRPAPGGRTAVRVFPAQAWDRFLLPGVRAEVWLPPGMPIEQGPAGGPPRLGLVLGAGNISAIPPTDLMTRMAVDHQVCVLKLNPVQESLRPVFEEVLEPLIRDGFLRITGGGPETGRRLTDDPRIEAIHLTGSDRTHDAIVWGADSDEQARRKAEGRPRPEVAGKILTSELGCVTPVIVAPGRWTRAELAAQAASVAGMVTHNAHHNCNAAQVLVLPAGWQQAGIFLDALREALRRAPPRRAWYPGARERHRALLEDHPGAELLGAADPPWALIPDLPPRPGERLYREEAFCGVLGVTRLPAPDALSFLLAAADFCNEVLWGTLSCMLLVDPRTERRLGPGLDEVLARLRYGGVAVNAWAGLLFGLMSPSWGAWPGHSLADIGSGIGVVHNTFLLRGPEKSVLRAPFRLRPKALWRPDHRTLDRLGPALLTFECRPSWRRGLRLLGPALRA